MQSSYCVWLVILLFVRDVSSPKWVISWAMYTLIMGYLKCGSFFIYLQSWKGLTRTSNDKNEPLFHTVLLFCYITLINLVSFFQRLQWYFFVCFVVFGVNEHPAVQILHHSAIYIMCISSVYFLNFLTNLKVIIPYVQLRECSSNVAGIGTLIFVCSSSWCHWILLATLL